MLAELNRKISNDPNFKLPEGYTKIVDKEVLSNYKIPDFIPMKQSQRIVIEVLDQLLFDKFGFHFIEPMTTIKDTVSVKPMVSYLAKDPLHALETNNKIIPKTTVRARPKA